MTREDWRWDAAGTLLQYRPVCCRFAVRDASAIKRSTERHKVSHLLVHPTDALPMLALPSWGGLGVLSMLLVHLGWMLSIYAQAQ